MRISLLLALIATLWLSNCKTDDETPTPVNNLVEAGAGVLITNEGGFNDGNASVSYYQFDDKSIQQELFAGVNGRPLGDILQSMTIVGDKAYLVLNNSQRIEIVDVNTFESEGAIGAPGSPRYFLPIDAETAYVSDLFGGVIHVVSLSNRAIVLSVPMPQGWTEQMIKVGNQVFVSSPSSFGQPPNRQLFVIDSENHVLVDSIEVGLSPTALVQDAAGKIWVLCSGDFDTGAPGGLYQVDPQTRAVLQSFPFADNSIGFAPRLAIDEAGQQLYYTKIDLYTLSTTSTALPSEPLIPADGRSLYGLGVEPGTGNIWLGDAGDYKSRQMIYRYDMDGNLLDSVLAGVAPSGFGFY
ncbi:MAG: hypothetical protein H6573_04080 [Lewinellaceae bacterium]|nr:hypothetical protein [Phaeodactylibacter sp.]MCB9346675.1 hypothetical protein [Lewinellaceae bacterium]